MPFSCDILLLLVTVEIFAWLVAIVCRGQQYFDPQIRFLPNLTSIMYYFLNRYNFKESPFNASIQRTFSNSQTNVFSEAPPSGKELLHRASFVWFPYFPHKIIWKNEREYLTCLRKKRDTNETYNPFLLYLNAIFKHS